MLVACLQNLCQTRGLESLLVEGCVKGRTLTLGGWVEADRTSDTSSDEEEDTEKEEEEDGRKLKELVSLHLHAI